MLINDEFEDYGITKKSFLQLAQFSTDNFQTTPMLVDQIRAHQDSARLLWLKTTARAAS